MKKFSESFLRVVLLVCLVGLPYYFIMEHFKSLQREIVAINLNTFMCMDIGVRNIHYSKPHKPFEWILKNDGSGMKMTFCGECADLLRAKDLYNDVGQWIEEVRYKELLEKERQLNEILKPIPMEDTEKCLKN